MIVLLQVTALAAALATPSPAPAAPVTLDVESGVSHEALSNDRPAWDGQYLRITQKGADKQVVYTELSSNRRFGESDDQVLVGTYVPLNEQWLASAEGSASNTHYIMPMYSLYAGLQYASGGNWYEGIGGRHTDYDAASVNSGTLTLEHYWNAYRFRYALTAANLAGLGTDVEQAAELDGYYGKYNSYLGLGYVAGREIDSAGVAHVITSHVDGWNVNGRHWMNANWAIVYGVGAFSQGAFYTRTGGHAGVDYRF
jgi:YaiO family outer membrane protein